MNRFETIAIGDELLTGRISDTNSTYIADHLFGTGRRLQRTTVIADDSDLIRSEIKAAAGRADVVICFGGLGPTSDDKTAEAVATLLGCRLTEHAPSREKMEGFYRARHREVTKQALKQVLYPQAGEPLFNSAGMAPGFRIELDGCQCYFLPGVPREMKTIYQEHIAPRLLGKNSEIRSQVWRCINIWESELQRQMDGIEAALPAGEAWLGYRTRFPENHLTLYARQSLSPQRFDQYASQIRDILKPWTYTESHLELEQLIHEKLKSRGWSVALAESCTGGLALQRLTRLPGASEMVWGGTTVYQVAAKRALLHIDNVDEPGGVSELCTRELAQKLKAQSGCAVVGAITGYVGMSGGTEKDPIGTIYLAVLTDKGLVEKKGVLPARPREESQWGASTYLLHLIWEAIQ